MGHRTVKVSRILLASLAFLFLSLGNLSAGEPPIPAPESETAPTFEETREGTGPGGIDNVPIGDAGAPLPADGGEEEAGEPPSPSVRDPIEPFNRAIFVFNDKAYFWVMKPVAQAYAFVVPEPARVSVRNFFSNVTTPVRFVNNLLQGRIRDSGTELLRFAINTTVGILGLFDAAKQDFGISRRNEDLGRTLGVYGLGHGIYIVLPLLGPSSLRDAAGLVGDYFLDPVNYLEDFETALAVKAFKAENEISLRIGDYEDLKASAVDPYIALRDAYIQNRAKKRPR